MGNARAREERARLRPINLITSVNYRKREHKLNCKLAMRNHREEHSTHSRCDAISGVTACLSRTGFSASKREKEEERGKGTFKAGERERKGRNFQCCAGFDYTRTRDILMQFLR